MRGTWVIMAAAAVAVAGCSSSGSNDARGVPAPASTSAPASAAPTSPSSASGGTSTSSAANSPATTPATSSAATALPSGPVPAGVDISDLSWTSPADGWLLGATKTCAAKPCTVILHTTDGGGTWSGGPAPKVTVALTSDNCYQVGCVSGIRFANQQVGYVFTGQGGTAATHNPLAVTIDGGKTWSVSEGSPVTALEPTSGGVFRVISTTGCPPGCSYTLQRAAVGSTAFTTVATPSLAGDATDLVFAGRDAYLVAYGNPAGGAQSAQPTYVVSHDSGATWLAGKDPCISLASGSLSGGDHREVDTRSFSAASGGVLSVVCQPRSSQQASALLVSHDSGNSFTKAGTEANGAEGFDGYGSLVQLSVTSLLSVASGAQAGGSIRLSSDSGRTFAGVLKLPPGPAAATDPGPTYASNAYAGAQDAKHARVVVAGEATILSTADGGKTWTTHTFT